MFQGIILLFECLIKYATRTVEVQSRLLWITMLFVLTIANDAPCAFLPEADRLTFRITRIHKDPVRGSLRKWNMKDQVVVISNEQGIVEIPFVEVLWLTPVGESEEWQTDHEGGWMILSNGDQFPFQLPIADEVTLVARTQRLGKIEIPLEMVRAMLLKRTRNEESRFRLIHRLSRLQNKEDVLLMSSGDSYAGTFLGISSNHYRFEVAGNQVKLDRAEVLSLKMNPELLVTPQFSGLHAVALLQDGSRLSLVPEQIQGGILKGRTVFQKSVAFALSDLVKLQVMGGGVVYLSDLKPACYQHTPFLSLPWMWCADQSVSGNAMRMRRRTMVKGIGMHSRSQITYTLDGTYRWLDGVVGIDDETKGQGSVVFRVETDGKVRFNSGLLRGIDAPVKLGRISIQGTRRLTLIVEFADRGDVLDHADWGDVRLVP